MPLRPTLEVFPASFPDEKPFQQELLSMIGELTDQIKLLNARIESAVESDIVLEDIKDENDTGDD